MGLSKTIWTNPTEFLRNQQPENPVLFFAPSVVQATARRFGDRHKHYRQHQRPQQRAPHTLAAERRVHLGVVHDDHRGVGAAVGHLGQALAVVRDVERALGVLLLVVNSV